LIQKAKKYAQKLGRNKWEGLTIEAHPQELLQLRKQEDLPAGLPLLKAMIRKHS
jgi:hypothetical protein